MNVQLGPQEYVFGCHAGTSSPLVGTAAGGQPGELVAEGLTNRDVAARLFISPHTVSGHLKNVFTKLAINSRVELVRIVDLND